MMTVGWGKRGLFAFVALLMLALAGMAAAETKAGSKAGPDAATVQAPLNYTAWEKFASSADTLISEPETDAARLDELRAEIATWRSRFLTAQSTNSARLGTLRAQIDALGPPPGDGATEPADIAERRAELNKQLAVVQAPSLAAVEAYSRADGLISEIDGVMRERQTDALLQLWPSPINPGNWPAAASAVMSESMAFATEFSKNWQDADRRATLLDKLPPIIGLLLFAALTIVRGRAVTEGLTQKLVERGQSNAREIWSFLASLGQYIVPVLGVFAFTWAVILSGMLGPMGTEVVQNLPLFGLVVFGARWLGACSFPQAANAPTHLRLGSDGRARGRFLSQMLGLALALEMLRKALLPESQLPEAAVAVLSFPTILIAGFFLFHLGRLMLHSANEEAAADGATPFAARLIGLMGRAAIIVAILGPILAIAGYIRAAQGIVFPMIASLGLVALLFTLQSLVGSVYAALMRTDERGRDALVPVLIGFFFAFASTPILALIWGARVADLTEVFTKLRDGFQIGQTRISPSDFILLAVVFGFWFLVTRLVQGALKTSILPKTSLDQGGQNAIVAGIGYIGIFLAALIGITAAGIDLSGLAIVAGALSVGIGFGLQNIVSNFVAGIILLIERPISQGDWIEVNGIMGTVQAISVRSTRIQTFDRTDVIVPNSDFVSGMVTNWTRFNLSGRLIVKVGVAYGTDTRKVASILQEIAEAQPLAVLNPPPTIVLANFGADSLDFEIRVILRDINFVTTVRSEINHEIARRFGEEGIEIPFGQRDIWIRNPESLSQMANPPPQRAADEPVPLMEPAPDGPKRVKPRKES